MPNVRNIQRWSVAAVMLGLLWAGRAPAQETVELASPDGKINVAVRVAAQSVSYSVTYDGRELLLEAPLGLDIDGVPGLLENLTVVETDRRQIDRSWQRVWGKCKDVRDRCNEVRIRLRSSSRPRRRMTLLWRAYDDGVAFRYVLPDQPQIKQVKVTGEGACFRFAGDPTVWAAHYGAFTTHQEAEFAEGKLSELKPDGIYGLPLLVKADETAWVAITEAALTDWAGLYLTAGAGQPGTLQTLLSPHPDDAGVCVETQTPCRSPWRVIMIAPTPGALIESNLIANLNPPCQIEDTSWIQPGLCAWDWWWCGRYAPEVDFKLGPNNETMKYFIDFAAEMGWTYQLVDWQWYGLPFADEIGGPAHPTSDITTCVPEIDVPALVQYARGKGVKLLVWLHWTHADKQMDEAFALYEKWGVAGVKIDFMARDDQAVVDFYHRVCKKAAEHHLTVDFHGAYKPTGVSRTYPNLLTREGVLGNEYNKWSDRVTPDHCLTIPFTRMLAGPMDFTPGGFRHGTKESFKVVGGDEPAPMVYGTRAFQLAMMVAYESPLQVMCDTPYEYRKSRAGLDFLKIVPTTWDETRVLNGRPGDFITVARRSGDEWYIGSMTDGTARRLDIPLDFLGSGPYQTTIWSDAASADSNPAALAKMTRLVDRNDRLNANMISAGGHVVHLRPARTPVAFPGAEGYGRFTRGGRGGDVYHVTTLDDAGPGSLRFGITSAPGPRTIVFDVSGTIELKSELRVGASHLTIAGQTAPGDGITLKDHTFSLKKCSDIIVRYLRVRLGDKNKEPGGYDTMTTDDIDNVILDHVSLSWAVDGTHDFRRGQNVTVQWCILSEALHDSIHNKGPHAMCGSYRNPLGPVTLHHNLYSTCRDRHPTLGSAAEGDPLTIVDFRNNVIYNWSATANFCDHFINAVNNLWRPGPETDPQRLPIAMKGGLPDAARGYMSGNVFEGNDEWTRDNYAALDWERWLGPDSNYLYRGTLADWKSGPRDLGADTPATQTARAACERVLQSAGASLARDAVDHRVVADVRNRSGRLLDSQDEVGGWPQLKSAPAPADTDRDGMPDAWEKARGLDPQNPDDRNGDPDGDGYTNLEDYLNGLVAAVK